MTAPAAARRYGVRLYPTQDDFVADRSRYVAFVGGRNSGKTYSGSVKAVLKAAEGGLGVIAAPDFPMLEHGAKRQFLERLDEAKVRHQVHKQLGTVVIPEWGAEVLFATLETESRVRGPNFRWGWGDEIEYVADRNVIRALKGAVRVGTYQLFYTSTPKGRRFLYDEFVVGADDQHALYRATTYDNVFVDAADYVAGLGYTGAFADQEIGAEFVAFEGLVYPAFDRERQVRPMDCTGWGTVLGLDVGTRNPTAVLTVRYAGDKMHVAAEHYERGMSSDAITDLAVGTWQAHVPRPEFMVVDPSAAGYIASLEQKGVAVRKGVNDVKVGIGRVASVLPDLTVDPSCVNLIAEFESYQYPDGRRGASDNPVKANDHALDALRYVCMELATPDPPKPKLAAGYDYARALRG